MTTQKQKYEYYNIYRVNAIVECPDGCERRWDYAVLSTKNRVIAIATKVLRSQPIYQKDHKLKRVQFSDDWQMRWRDNSLELLVDKEEYLIIKQTKKVVDKK